MREILIVIAYLVFGLALFFSFWRWFTQDDDISGNRVVSFLLLFMWPVALSALAFFAFMCWLMEVGEKVMKK